MSEKTSINSFVQHFTTDFARSNMFQVSFEGVQLKTPSAKEHLTMACKGIQIPGVTFIEGKYMFNGFNRKSAIGADFDPIALTFLVDGSGKTLEIFEEWSNKIINKQTGKFGFKEDYQTDITIMLLDRTENIYDKIKVFEAYPTNIDAVDINWDNADTIMEITVSFNFLKVISTYNGAAPAKLEPQKRFSPSNFTNSPFRINSPKFSDVANKLSYGIKQINEVNDVVNKVSNVITPLTGASDVVNKATLGITNPFNEANDVVNKVSNVITPPKNAEDVINKTNDVEDMIKKAQSLF